MNGASMKYTHKLIVFIFILLAAQTAFGQTRQDRLRQKGYINPEEIVSLDSTLTVDQALAILDTMSEKFVGKIIDYPGTHTGKIGVWVFNQHWHDALESILKLNGLWYREENRFIRIITPEGEVRGGPVTPAAGGPATPGKMEERPPTLESRDVKISAVFFTVNLDRAQNYGISWNFYRAPKTNNEPSVDAYVSSGMAAKDTLNFGSTLPRPPLLDEALGAGISSPLLSFGNIDALVKFFGSNQIGEVTISPDVIVRDGKEGKIVVGSTIFITTKDIAGNTIQQPLEAGTIIQVTPVTYTQSDTDFIDLTLKVEQSAAQQGVTGVTINKSQVLTHILLFDGEETVIGGLMSNTETEVREGIPFLRDLPWWFFGLRYLFGSEGKEKIKEELVILLKAELVPQIRQRFSERGNHENLIEKKRKEFQMEYEKK